MTRIFYIAILILTFLVTSCVKEKDYFLPDGTFEFVGDVQTLRQNLRPQPVLVSFHMPEEKTLIPISDRVHLVMEEGALLDESGENYSGQVDVRLLTAADISEWAGWDFSMITEDGFLDAVGSQKIIFKSGDNFHLSINPENPPVIRWLSDDERKPVSLFKMDKEIGKWKFYSTEVEYVERELDLNGQSELSLGYEFSVSDDGWFTIGTELLKPHGSDICLNHTEGFTRTNTTSFVIFRNYNTLVILNGWDEENPYRTCNSQLRLPINEDVRVASVSGISGNRFFFDQVDFNLSSSNFEIDMEPKKSNLSQILQRLNN